MDVVEENTDFLIVDKPAGLSMQVEAEGSESVLLSLKRQLGYETLYPVHRLDKMTSGLLIVAKTLEAAQQFQRMFSEHQVQKYYLALSDKKPKKKQGLIQGDMLPARRGSYRLATTRTNPAVTRFISQSVVPGLRLFLLKPLTGKTHQLRVAMKSLSAPILGDPRYSQTLQAKEQDRGYLHAYALCFEWKGVARRWVLAPKSGQAFLRSETIAAIQDWQTPWLLIQDKNKQHSGEKG
ncbi:TIGR01621 family pseudouridine synthase [Thiomicrorhabdus sp.]|uniref:TIGR01621 family pseudouridine synthase n=1 Tax=Thiomicrorhabdus sp. TaxID=2039724 RepID=UPI0029C71788|nr:TIGR01621 family pseudouridine synthase [Thiomicrorhabdus sp.]